ncbi:actin nucleation-promoting factor WASL-like [Lycorma delicatula]|uniref:actin nucleation-promoting factor WASL-like n=1 Tax=Lycorma delicatula TaxID=130591 RepID=UPI003F50EAD7
MKSESFPPPEQQGSGLLSQEENEQVFSLLGHRCQTLATTIVQLFVTMGPDHNEWVKKDTGVLCLVKDNPKRSYFFRLYCLSRNRLVWEHEIYNEIDYLAPRRFLHTFEAEDYITAFNFASEDEADWLRGVLLKKREEKKQRRERRTRCMQQRDQSLQPHSMINGSVPLHSHANLSLSAGSHRTGKRKEKDVKRRLTKADIGNPVDFRHISHVGFDPNKGFDCENIEDPQLKQFFNKAGVSDNQLQDRKTREFIYDFIEKNGGLDAVKNDVRPPPVPARSAPTSRAAPPPPPSRTGPLPPAPPSHTPPPPPPPPLRTLPQRPQESPQGKWNPPPPPPPPPAPPLTAPPDDVLPPPSYLPPLPTVDPHSALMESIRSGKALKHVDIDDRSTKTTDSRGELLDQIRQGIELKPVQPENRTALNSLPEDGLAGALARALAERSKAIHSDSSASSNEDEDDEDDEWED